MTGAKIFIHCILLSNIFSPLFISGSEPIPTGYVEKVIEKRNPISETQKLLQVLSNPKLESVKGEKFFNSWYKQHMNGSNFKKFRLKSYHHLLTLAFNDFGLSLG